jgi:uncharacterized membrane protein YfcA
MELILIGIVGGVISGMGVGGGTLLIPLLTLFMGFSQQSAQGVNLVAYLPAAVSALIVYYKAGKLNLRFSLKLLIPGAVGAAAGALLALVLPADYLRLIFGIALLILSIQQFIKNEKHYKALKNKADNKP